MAPAPAYLKRVCSVEGCDRPHRVHGLCNMHYHRLRRHGNPLLGANRATEPGEPARFLREVVLHYRGDDCLIWKFSRRDGYAAIKVLGRTKGVHVLVCEHEHGPKPSPKHEVAHSCLNGRFGCVTPRHVRWATHAENQARRRNRRKLIVRTT